MNKKGFTLVELLAVIAILAILAIIAIPNVLKLFNESKKNIFLTETKTVYREALKKYASEALKGNEISVISSNGENKLDISGNIEYIVKIDNGKIKEMKVKDKNYYISFSGGNINDLTTNDIESITDDKNYDLSLDTNKPVNNCTFDGELVQGAEYINGQYTYKYMTMYFVFWTSIPIGMTTPDGQLIDGWGVKLTDEDSTDAVTTPLCTSINGKPIVSTSGMFSNSKSTSIDLSSFDTSNVLFMQDMFYGSQATEIIGLDKLNTSNVYNMYFMFRDCKATELDLSSFDTSKVTDMSDMFYNNKATTIYVSNKWNTSRITDSTGMFNNNTNLVGGAGTRYSSSNPTDKTYARVDGGPSNPGYFTYKAN